MARPDKKLVVERARHVPLGLFLMFGAPNMKGFWSGN
jgi:hypothetical protein